MGRCAVGRRESKKDHTWAVLIAVGMGLFKAHSFARTTIDQITEAADVAKGTFYNYFTTKEDLLIAGMLIEQGESAAAVRDEVFALPAAADRLRQVVTWSAAWIGEHAELAVVWCLERLRRGCGDGPSGFDQLLLDVVTAGQAAGDLRQDRAPALMALELTGIFVTYILQWYQGGQAFDLARAMEEALQTYLLGAQSGGGM